MAKEPKQFELDLKGKPVVHWTTEQSLKLISILCWLGMTGLFFLIYSWR